MRIRKLLIANRGEVAVRVAAAAADLGITSVGIYARDDGTSLHTRKVDHAVPLHGGREAYLDMEQIIEVAKTEGCDALHPGYGFLSESADFARRCGEEGLCFVGADAETLDLCGDKARTLALAAELGIPVLPGIHAAATLDEVKAFFREFGEGAGIMIKAVAGGGGRGMRAVHRCEDIEREYERCRSEALTSFGRGDVYVEQLLAPARHVEVQVMADCEGGVSHLWDRECSLQRRHQKVVEVAPSPGLPAELRRELIEAALRIAGAVGLRGLATVEFLVNASRKGGGPRFAFMEVNPRLQVEHTVTEAVTGLDLVRMQLALSCGATLRDLGVPARGIPEPRGYAMELRINMESLNERGEVLPSTGVLTVFEPPSGPGIRVDTCGYTGYRPNMVYDSLLAKLIVSSPSPAYGDVVCKAYRALCEFRLAGIDTNIGFLCNLLRMPAVTDNDVHTGFIEENLAVLTAEPETAHRRLFFPPEGVKAESAPTAGDASAGNAAASQAPPDTVAVAAPLSGMVAGIAVVPGEDVRSGQVLLYLEAMKIEHEVRAHVGGTVRSLAVGPGDSVLSGQAVAFIEPGDVGGEVEQEEESADLDTIRADLAEVKARHEITLDSSRPEAVAKRRASGQRTARENVADLCDPGSFIEYGALVLAGRRSSMPLEELIKASPADGLIAGIGTVNGSIFDAERARTMVLAYDYTVFGGSQGIMSHRKLDRMLALAKRWRLPIVLFAEGGGGRAGDSDFRTVSALDTPSFYNYAVLSGLVPRVGIVSGRCFAGNACLLGCSDVIIATENANIGMGGPPMIEGGGLGTWAPEDIGPIDVQSPNGVVDIRVKDEAEAVAAAKKYLSYFQGPLASWSCEDQRKMRLLVPENRKRAYDVRTVIATLADTGSVLELRREFGVGMITALVRIEGRPVGLLANNPHHLGGAIDSDAADKAARFMQLCDAFDLPIVSLCDTPGFMIGPEAEKTAAVRHYSRLFLTGASLRVPVFAVVLRKGYGLGVQSVVGGHFHVPFFTVSWPTGEFGAMNLEGAVRLALRRELAAIEDPEERERTFRHIVEGVYEAGKAINTASILEIDDVIDPAETRDWIVKGLRSVPQRAAPTWVSERKARRVIDAW
ncbi:MAG: carbamoyl-phosphate synthase large subunit [Actinobacteria bacterium]|nr:carbamoyl-phosphate synthase large subunit [Actinomycetota bacterium]